jgi:PAS domain S-box-containing protein
MPGNASRRFWPEPQRPDRAVIDLDDARLATAFEHSPLGMCVTEGEVIVLGNRELAWMMGCEPEQLAGATLSQFHPSPQEYQRIEQAAQAELRGSGCHAGERILRRRDGGLFWCQVVVRAVDRGDPRRQAVWSFYDLSALRPVVRHLTGREREIAARLVTGGTSKQIAQLVGISPRTVEGYRGRLMKKLGASNQGQLVARLAGVLAPQGG